MSCSILQCGNVLLQPIARQRMYNIRLNDDNITKAMHCSLCLTWSWAMWTLHAIRLTLRIGCLILMHITLGLYQITFKKNFVYPFI